MASLFTCVDDIDGDVDVDDHQDGSVGRERSGVADWGLEDRQLAATSHRPQASSAVHHHPDLRQPCHHHQSALVLEISTFWNVSIFFPANT